MQQANRELETKLGQAEVKNSELAKEAEELAQKNSRMCAELAEIGELVKQLSKEKVVGERSLQERAVHAEVRGDWGWGGGRRMVAGKRFLQEQSCTHQGEGGLGSEIEGNGVGWCLKMTDEEGCPEI